MTSLDIKLNANGVCEGCSKRNDPDYYLRHNCLPIWYKDGRPVFVLPPELCGLSYAEKMLLQQASPFIPLQHIKNGTFGLSGHVCAFEQNI